MKTKYQVRKLRAEALEKERKGYAKSLSRKERASALKLLAEMGPGRTSQLLRLAEQRGKQEALIDAVFGDKIDAIFGDEEKLAGRRTKAEAKADAARARIYARMRKADRREIKAAGRPR